MRNQVFFSYNQQDKQWLDEILKGLQPFLRQQPFLLWDETKIQAGKEWRKEINQALSLAKVAVLLVSPDFLASDFIAEHILPPLLDAVEHKELTILWIAVRPCAYKETDIRRYQAVNSPSKPLTALKDSKREDALVSIRQQIAQAARKPTKAIIVNIPAPDQKIIDPNKVEHILDSNPLEPKALICLDNFDALASNPQISIQREMSHLRSLVHWLGTHHEVLLSVILNIPETFDVRKYPNRSESPWYSMFLTLPIEELSQLRSMSMLALAGITDDTQVAFCINKAKKRLPLDLLVLAYLLKEHATSTPTDDELIEKKYLQVEPLLRGTEMNGASLDKEKIVLRNDGM